LKFLFKYPSRGRPEKFKEILNKWYSMLSGKHECHFVVTLDSDDKTMNNPVMRAWLANDAAIDSIQRPVLGMAKRKNFHYQFGNSQTKVEACNADMYIVKDWDIVVLVSDDMLPQVQGYDDIIANDMQKYFPALDGALHYNDGLHGNNTLITLSIMGRKLYDYFGYIYHPDYNSFYCDTEFTQVVKKIDKYKYIPEIIVRHQWIHSDEMAKIGTEKGKDDARIYKQRSELGFSKPNFYSQNMEEKYIYRHFMDKTGKFLDIGAWDGKTFSNTYKLAKLGWQGVCVEPSPIAFKGLFENYKDNDKIQLVNCAVADRSELMTFYESNGDAIGSLDQSHKDKWQKNVFFREILTKTVTFDELCDMTGYDFDFISIDTEGTSLEIFRHLPFQQLKNLSCICVEYDGKNDLVCNIGKTVGFEKVYESSENIVLCKTK